METLIVCTVALLVSGLTFFSAFAGALLGRELLKKITLRTVQIVIGVMLIFLGVILSIGLI